ASASWTQRRIGGIEAVHLIHVADAVRLGDVGGKSTHERRIRLRSQRPARLQFQAFKVTDLPSLKSKTAASVREAMRKASGAATAAGINLSPDPGSFFDGRSCGIVSFYLWYKFRSHGPTRFH